MLFWQDGENTNNLRRRLEMMSMEEADARGIGVFRGLIYVIVPWLVLGAALVVYALVG